MKLDKLDLRAQQSFDDPSEWRSCKLTLRRHIVSVGHILLG